MRIGVVLSSLRNRLRAFRGETRGNVMITFALALVPIIGFVGAAVDYSRGNSTKAAMQSAVDSAALMLSKEAQSLTTAQLNTKADAMFKALFHRTDIANLVVTPTFLNPGTGSYKLTLTATASVPTTFTKVIGQDHINVDVSSQVVWGVKRLELALALDVTGSMASNNKMTELKKAAKSLLTTLKAAAKKDGDIKVAIVPFNIDVNVNPTNVNANWINWAEWEAPPAGSTPASNVGPGSTCPWTTSANGFRCQASPTNGSSVVSNVPSSGTYSGYICPTAKGTTYYNGCYNSVQKAPKVVGTGSSASCSGYSNCTCSGGGSNKVCTQTFPGQYDHTWRPAGTPAAPAHSTWNGCVTDRNQDYDVNNTAPSTSITESQFVSHQYSVCPVALMPLSFDWTALNDKIDALQPNGNTNVTIGLAWAFHALTPAGPFNTAAVATTDLDKVIILLTDGDNTQNRWTSSQTDIDARTKKACDNVKAANIKLYTVRVIDGNATLLQQCATRSDMYYNVQNSSQLNDVFSAIAQNLANLRIAK